MEVQKIYKNWDRATESRFQLNDHSLTKISLNLNIANFDNIYDNANTKFQQTWNIDVTSFK